jgi:hypothetical protein
MKRHGSNVASSSQLWSGLVHRPTAILLQPQSSPPIFLSIRAHRGASSCRSGIGAQFERPDELKLARERNRHLAFGQGIHYCLGVSLTRLEGNIADQ